MNKNYKLIVLLLCLGNITISFNTGAVAAAIPLIAESLGKPDWLVSKIVSFYMIPYGLGALMYAPLARYFTYRRILSLAMAVYALASLVSGLSYRVENIFMAQMVTGLVASSLTPLSLMMIGEFFDKEIRGRLVGTYFGCSFLASTIGMIFMGTVDWRWLFFIPAMLGLMTSLSLLLTKNDLLNRSHQAPVNYFDAFTKKSIRDVFLLIFTLSFLYHGVHKWYGVYLSREYHLDKLAISFILILVAICGLLGQQIGGYLSDKRGRVVTGMMGTIVLATATMLLVGHYPTVVLVMVLAFIGMGWTISHNAISTILTDFPDEDRPIIASLNSSVRFVSGGIGFFVSSLFVEKNFGLTFFGIGILMFMASFFLKRIKFAPAPSSQRQEAEII